MWCIKKRDFGKALKYTPKSLTFSDASQMRHYHKKLLLLERVNNNA